MFFIGHGHYYTVSKWVEFYVSIGTGTDKLLQLQGVYEFNQANFQEIPGGILRKIQDMFALLRPPSESWNTHNMGISALPSRIGIWGSVISSPTGVQGGAPAENGFWCIWNLKKTHPMAINCVFLQRIFIHIFMTGNQRGRSSTSCTKISRRTN